MAKRVPRRGKTYRTGSYLQIIGASVSLLLSGLIIAVSVLMHDNHLTISSNYQMVVDIINFLKDHYAIVLTVSAIGLAVALANIWMAAYGMEKRAHKAIQGLLGVLSVASLSVIGLIGGLLVWFSISEGWNVVKTIEIPRIALRPGQAGPQQPGRPGAGAQRPQQTGAPRR